MAVLTTHNDLTRVNVVLESALAQGAGFSTSLLIVDEATSSLDGDRTRRYTSVTGAAADQTAGFLSAQAVAFITAAFSQRRAPRDVLVGRQAVAESLTDAYTAIKADDDDFYGVNIQARTAADALALAPVMVTDAADPDSRGRILFIQSSDVEWLTTGFASAYSAIETRRTALLWHDTDTVPAEFAWSAGRLAYDPDVQSVPWNTPIDAVASYAANITPAQKGFLRGNFANPMLPRGNEPRHVDQGVTLENRPIDHVLTGDWFDVRLTEAVNNRLNQLHGSGIKLPINGTGQAICKGEVNALFRQGLRGVSPHFQGTPRIVAEAITAADITNRTLRFSGAAQLTTSAREFEFEFIFSQQPIA